MNDSWSSEETEPSHGRHEVTDGAPTATARRSARYEERKSEPDARRERYPWVGAILLLGGLIAGGVGLAMIGMDLDQPGQPEVAPERWWLVFGGGVAIAWAAPWFLRPRGRRRMAIVVGICTATILAVAWFAIDGLNG